MSHRSTRRRFLLAGAVLLPPFVSGCSQFPGTGSSQPTETTHPDVGTDSYGIELRSRLDGAATIVLETREPFADDPIWRKEVTLNPGNPAVYDSVLTAEHGEQTLTAKLTAVDDEDLEKSQTDGVRITPGSEDAPDVRRFEIVVQKVGGDRYVIKIINPENMQGQG